MRWRAGEEALEGIRAHSGSVDLVLADLFMPRMGGLELCTRIAAGRPGTKVVGMSAGIKGREQAAMAGLPFLQKPFTLSALRARIEAVLNGSDGAPRTG
jgi:DNA-binding response OmpR family regulator